MIESIVPLTVRLISAILLGLLVTLGDLFRHIVVHLVEHPDRDDPQDKSVREQEFRLDRFLALIVGN